MQAKSFVSEKRNAVHHFYAYLGLGPSRTHAVGLCEPMVIQRTAYVRRT